LTKRFPVCILYLSPPREAAERERTKEMTERKNQYDGWCVNCRSKVPAEAGFCSRKADGKWQVRHAVCPAPEKAPAPEFPVPVGYYAIPSRKPGQDLDFFCIKAGKGKWEGRTFVNEVIGGRVVFGVRLSRDEQAAAVEGILAVGIEATRKRYADEIGNCWNCNKLLTDNESRALGIGPVCRKLGLAAERQAA
jgi:hypothetical protein